MLPNAAVAQLLRRSREGDQGALDQLMPLVYQQLRRLAAAYLQNQAPGHTLQPTALVHEAYLRMLGSGADWNDRAHFFHLAATIMRQILVDHARAKVALKRGGGQSKLAFQDELLYSDEKAGELVALDDALRDLSAFDERKAQVIELRYFGGLSVDETAEVLCISSATVGRETRQAEAWLRHQIDKA